MLWERGHSLFTFLQVPALLVRWCQTVYVADQFGHITRVARSVDRRYTVDQLDEALRSVKHLAKKAITEHITAYAVVIDTRRRTPHIIARWRLYEITRLPKPRRYNSMTYMGLQPYDTSSSSSSEASEHDIQQHGEEAADDEMSEAWHSDVENGRPV
jgi:hypothetical protein